MRGRTILAVVGLAIVLGAANFAIWHHQRIVDDGRLILLELRPVDPRSLMQGDYMALRYSERAFPSSSMRSQLSGRGVLIVALDQDNVATFVRVDDGANLAPNQARLKYKQINKNGEIRLGAESFFFQEGQATLFNNARYGVFRADANGNSVLVGLADEQRRQIRPPDES